jgi:xylanolytic transcriptional activator XlnR
VQTGGFDRTDMIVEMDEEIWSPSAPTPIHQQFPTQKPDMHVSSPGWQTLSASESTAYSMSCTTDSTLAGSGFEPPVNQLMIDPLLLGAGEVNGFAHAPMHPAIPRNQDLMFAMNDMHLVADSGTPVTMHHPDYHQMGYAMPFSAVRQSSPHSYGSADTGSPQSGVSATSSGQGLTACRYPVLKPLLPHLSSIMSVSMACDLLEFYFQSSSSIFMEPASPYILGSVFRKRSFLRQHKPRKCSPALLASMLWIAAQTSEASWLTSSPSARGSMCQKLWKLSIDLLKPLVHSPTGPHGVNPGSGGMVSPAAHDAFGVERVMGRYDSRLEPGSPPVSTLDDVATYLNLGVVTSASEYKAASLRWWNAAW